MGKPEYTSISRSVKASRVNGRLLARIPKIEASPQMTTEGKKQYKSHPGDRDFSVCLVVGRNIKLYPFLFVLILFARSMYVRRPKLASERGWRRREHFRQFMSSQKKRRRGRRKRKKRRLAKRFKEQGSE